MAPDREGLRSQGKEGGGGIAPAISTTSDTAMRPQNERGGVSTGELQVNRLASFPRGVIDARRQLHSERLDHFDASGQLSRGYQARLDAPPRVAAVEFADEDVAELVAGGLLEAHR